MYSEDTTKYRIRLNVHTEGVVERSDVVGAIFGQTEGLLGDELDLKELQRMGRIGRIDVQISSKLGKSTGEIIISSSLDRAETAVLAASMESIERIGPCESTISVETIEDIRITKRRNILERAKILLHENFDDSSIDTEGLIDEVRESQRIERIENIGAENVPAGPNVLKSDAIIVVEGRADVINLLRYGIKNAVAVEGTNTPGLIVELCKKKTCTAFLDGDRGGDLILRELLQVADIDFVAFAPRGESVEYMSRKEILKSLRNKVTVDYVLEDYITSENAVKPYYSDISRNSDFDELELEAEPEQTPKDTKLNPVEDEQVTEKNTDNKLWTHMENVKGHRIARFLSNEQAIIKELPITEVESALEEFREEDGVAGVVIDDNINQMMLDRFSLLGIEYLSAQSFQDIVKRPASVRLIKFK